jgi:hypothetical protein
MALFSTCFLDANAPLFPYEILNICPIHGILGLPADIPPISTASRERIFQPSAGFLSAIFAILNTQE